MSKNLDRSVDFNTPTTYLLTVLVFITICAWFIYTISPFGSANNEILLNAFSANPYLNGLIIGVLFFGMVYHLKQIIIIYPNLNWINLFRETIDPTQAKFPRAPSLIRPMTNLLLDADKKNSSLSTFTTQAILDSIGTRIDESREFGHYVGSLLMYLGLLGTFWGLLITIDQVTSSLTGFSAQGDPDIIVSDLIANLSGPLAGMGTAFSSSLFGLTGSVMVGFLDLQSTSAQNKFYTDLEEWLSIITETNNNQQISKNNNKDLHIFINNAIDDYINKSKTNNK